MLTLNFSDMRRGCATHRSTRHSSDQVVRALHVRQHSMVTQSRTLRISGNDTLNFTPLVPSGSVVVNVAVNSTFASDATSTMANHVPSDGIMNATSLSSASVVNATAMDSANITNLAPSDVMPDDDCDDKFYGEVRAYPDYLLGILEAQAEEVRLLHREVASVRQEKAVSCSNTQYLETTDDRSFRRP